MPVIKSAKKKLRADKKREAANKKVKTNIDSAIKKAKKKPNDKNLQEAFRAIDKGVKNKIFHKNKASHIKSGLSKLVSGKSKSTSKSKALK